MVVGATVRSDTEAAREISLVRNGDGPEASWSAEVVGLPGCSATASTPEEALRRAWAAAGGSLERTDESRDGSPPATGAKHSGRLLVRMPATLHDDLARVAKAEGVSLNQWITGALASAAEWRASGRGDAGPGASTQGSPAARGSDRFTRAVLVANLAAVLIATLVAITLLIAWRAGW